MFDLRQLRVLVEVARTGSYTAAALSLGYTQSAVSYQMAQLQRRAGVPLAVKVGRGVQLTPAGQSLAQHALTALAVLRAAEESLSSLQPHGMAQVRLAAFQGACSGLVPGALRLLQEYAPGVNLRIDQVDPSETLVLLRNGDADLGLLCSWDDDLAPEGESRLLSVPLLRERRCVIMRYDHPLASAEEVDLADLGAEDWVLVGRQESFVAACARRGCRPRIAASLGDVLAMQQLVAAGLGIGFLDELALAFHLDPQLVARPLRNWPTRHTYALLWPEMATVPTVAAALKAIRMAASRLRLGPPALPEGSGGPATDTCGSSEDG
ncbi:LysR family transcriptional regulator [Kitasatospora sp. NPDC057015]|uniref:LysR family transcriptional regulator n=1 Tax=Kitasatospora sp. NPDC057015 TaxID=3346001 RepID=UPI0036382848